MCNVTLNVINVTFKCISILMIVNNLRLRKYLTHINSYEVKFTEKSENGPNVQQVWH